MASTNTSATSRYYHVHHEGDVKSLVSLLQSGKRDGHSMYRALTRQVIGDLSKHQHIRDAVLHFAISARSNANHPLHSSYLEREASFRQQTGMDVFTVLDCPDLVPADPHLCWIVASALKMQICLYALITSSSKERELYHTTSILSAKQHAICEPRLWLAQPPLQPAPRTLDTTSSIENRRSTHCRIKRPATEMAILCTEPWLGRSYETHQSTSRFVTKS